MIIGIDGHALGDRSGGNETYCRNLIKGFSPEETKDMILFLSKNYTEEFPEFQGRILHFKSANPFIRNFIEIPYFMLKYRLTVMHLFYFIPFLRFCPVIVTIHDISFEHFSDIFTKKDYFAQKKLIPYAAKKSRYIITDSEYSKKDICQHYGIEEHRVVNAQAAVSEKFRPLNLSEDETKAIREKFGIRKNFILCVGNLQPRKNIKRLLEAYAMLVERNTSAVELVIVGKKAWMYEDIFDKIQDRDIRRNIILTDYVTEEELVKLYNMATVFVYPSIFEGFGLPVLEALACRTPTAASNVTSIPEVAGDAALLFDPFDVQDICNKLELLLTDADLREKYRRFSSVQAQKFTWSKTAHKIFKVYEQITADTSN